MVRTRFQGDCNRAMASRIRTMGSVPPDYTGPVYWRIKHCKPIRTAGHEPLEFLEDAGRWNRLYVDPHHMPGKTIYTSGTVFDEAGALLAEWRTPLKAKRLSAKPVRVEYAPGLYGARVSERVHDAIQQLEPGKHHAVPIDVSHVDGRLERRYEMLFAAASSFPHRELDFAANNLTPIKGSNPPQFIAPLWLYANAEPHFGYLDGALVDGLHWFNGTHANQYLSHALFEKLSPMGDIFEPWDAAIPIGIGDHAIKSSVLRQDAGNEVRTFKDRLRSLFGNKQTT